MDPGAGPPKARPGASRRHTPLGRGAWRRTGRGAVLASLILGLAASHLLWAARDTWPPPWDQALHLENALRCGQALSEGRWRDALRLSGYYPPLVHCAAGLLHQGLGSSRLIALLVIQGALALIVLSADALARAVGLGPAAGLAAALLAGASTQVVLEGRSFMLDLPLTALVSLTALALVRGQPFTDTRWALGVGVLAGLGLLTKWTYAFFALPLLGFGWWLARWRLPVPRRCAAAVLALTALLVAAPWYLHHAGLPGSLLRNAFAAGVAEGDPGLGHLAGWTYYLAALPRQLGIPGLLALAAGLLALATGRARRPGGGPGAPGLALLLGGIGAPLLIFTLLGNKDDRYTMPVLPLLAVPSVAWLSRLPPRARGAALAGLGALTLLHVAVVGWGWPDAAAARARMDRGWLVPAFPPRTERWPGVAIVERIAADLARQPGPRAGARPATVSVVPDHPALSRFTLSYEAVGQGVAVRAVRAFPESPRFVEYVVTKTGDQGPLHTTARARAVMARLAAGDPALADVLAPLAAWDLPDGSRATLHRVAGSPREGISAEGLVARLRALGRGALGDLARDVEGLRVDAEPGPPDETRAGRIRRLHLGLEVARVGDFRRTATALRVRSLELTVEDARIDPAALVREGRLALLGAGRLVVRRAEVRADDLADALADLAPVLRSPNVAITMGVLAVTATVGGVEVAVRVRPDLVAGAGGGLSLWAESLRVGGVPVPAPLANACLALANPVLAWRRAPFALDVAPLVWHDGVVRVGVSTGR